MSTRVAIHGAAGKMGQRLIALGSADPELTVSQAIEAVGHPRLGHDAGLLAGIGSLGVPLSDTLQSPVDVVIDFSVPQGAERITRSCIEQKVPLVMATTGLEAEQKELIHAAAKSIPVLWAPSMSLAVNLSMKLVEMAGRSLAGQGAEVDVEIIERHHRFKEDAPSGTALRFGEVVADAMGQTVHTHGREGRPGRRPRNEIGYHALRTGDNPGEHTIVFGLLGETIEVTVRASNRDCYAHGALAAAKFLLGKPAGLYTMNDVLKLNA